MKTTTLPYSGFRKKSLDSICVSFRGVGVLLHLKSIPIPLKLTKLCIQCQNNIFSFFGVPVLNSEGDEGLCLIHESLCLLYLNKYFYFYFGILEQELFAFVFQIHLEVFQLLLSNTGTCQTFP